MEHIYHLLETVSASENPYLAQSVIQQGLKLGLSPMDILMGVVQPALYEVGKRWEIGDLTVEQEHRFTAYCEGLFHLLYFDSFVDHLDLRQSKHPQVLLVNAPENYHSLGIRMVELWLLSNAISCYTVYPGIPVPEIMELVRSLDPNVLGISAALSSHIASVHEIEEQINKINQLDALTILSGGYAVKTMPFEEKLIRAKWIRDLDTFLIEIQKSKAIREERIQSKAG